MTYFAFGVASGIPYAFFKPLYSIGQLSLTQCVSYSSQLDIPQKATSKSSDLPILLLCPSDCYSKGLCHLTMGFPTAATKKALSQGCVHVSKRQFRSREPAPPLQPCAGWWGGGVGGRLLTRPPHFKMSTFKMSTVLRSPQGGQICPDEPVC